MKLLCLQMMQIPFRSNPKEATMSYTSYFFTGVIKSGDSYIGRYDGEFVGSFKTWKEANDAVKAASRR